MCLVSRLDEFEGQGHQGQKTAYFGPFGGLHAVCLVKLWHFSSEVAKSALLKICTSLFAFKPLCSYCNCFMLFVHESAAIKTGFFSYTENGNTGA